jgi:hypothetical protein
MSDSETSSSDIKVKYQNSNGENLLEDKSNDKKQQQTTDTDYYFGMIANPSKVTAKPKSETETSELENLLKSTDSESSKKSKRSEESSSSSESSKRSSSDSSSSRKSSESKPKYDQINVSPKGPIPPVFKPPSNPVPPTINFNNPNNSVQNQNQNQAQPQSTAEIKPVEQAPKPLTQQEIRMKKIELLRKLCEIKAKGYQLSKEYDFNSSLEEMEYEYELLRSFADKRNGVKIFKSGMLQAVSVIEFLNDKYDPFDFQLSGWGEHMSVEIDSWEDVLEEIYEKYKGSGKKMAPEIKLLYLIIASGSAFHFSKSQASKLPGLDTMLASNPALLSKIINPGKGESSQFMTPQELNIEKQREELRKKEAEAKQKIQQQMQQQMQQQQMQQQSYIEQLQSQLQRQNEMISNQQSMINKSSEPATYGAGFSNASYNEPQPANSKPTALPKQIPASQLRPIIPSIQAPDQVKSILDRIHNLKSSNIKPSNTETQDETSSNNDRIVEETTISESNPNKKKTGRKPKKSNISIF